MEPPSEMDPWGLACSKTPLHRQGVEGTAQAQKLFLMPQTCARLAMPSACIDRPSSHGGNPGKRSSGLPHPKAPFAQVDSQLHLQALRFVIAHGVVEFVECGQEP